jgi:hypothetical protein
MCVHRVRVGGRPRHHILVAGSLILFATTPQYALSQSGDPEPIAPEIAVPSDEVPALLPSRNQEPNASDQPSMSMAKPAQPTEEMVSPETAVSGAVDQVKSYLWSVYQRSGTKMDSHGDFTWKDVTAAEVWGLSMEDYVIGGMDADFRELLFAAGRAMDAAGIDWSILSGFRDDFRQSLASGLRARGGNSFHGGSVATGGYGHGCAADLASSDGLSDDKVWSWLDRRGQQFGLYRPLPGADPAHLQPSAGWRQLAQKLRDERRIATYDSKNETAIEHKFGTSGAANLAQLSAERLNCAQVRKVVASSETLRSAHATHVRPSPAPKEHHIKGHEKTARDLTRSTSNGRSAQAKGRGSRNRRG